MVRPVFTIGPSPDAKALRTAVFIEEQHVVHEYDELDPGSWSLVLYFDQIPVGTGRLVRLDPQTGRIGRVAVRKEFRHKKIGSYVLAFLERKALEIGITQIELHAQTDKLPFYQKAGYHILTGEIFYDENMPHVAMGKALKQRKRKAK